MLESTIKIFLLNQEVTYVQIPTKLLTDGNQAILGKMANFWALITTKLTVCKYNLVRVYVDL